MKCREQEKTANAPLRRPNSLHHQQHFIKQQWLAEEEGGLATNTDRCTHPAAAAAFKRTAGCSRNVHTRRPRNKPPTCTAFL